ncbi:hypothetical protein [Nonomuraea diastatica]|uniref:hypothetical protein n=1 Tax=Nonomuraea diastatica TaxID=1848329 RepID=UPI001C702EAE|nr:hypothetical protein [Nonomuraea diastatica]
MIQRIDRMMINAAFDRLGLRQIRVPLIQPPPSRLAWLDLVQRRFLWTIGVPWQRATRIEARDFCRWMLISGKPSRPHWRQHGRAVEPTSTGKAYAPSVRAHCETVLRSFYEFHLETGQGPIVNPFPLDRARRGRRANAHHNPMEPYRNERAGLYRPTVPSRVPRSVPDEEFNEIFAKLPSHRDRALVAFYVSTGARASELLSVTQSGVDPGRQLITVTRKGSREQQQLPASTDAFVWLRLYQAEMDGLFQRGRPGQLAAALRAGALTADAVALEARKAADEATGQPGQPGQSADSATSPTVASLTARRLEKLPPDTRPLPSVAAYDQLLRRTRITQEGNARP